MQLGSSKRGKAHETAAELPLRVAEGDCHSEPSTAMAVVPLIKGCVEFYAKVVGPMSAVGLIAASSSS